MDTRSLIRKALPYYVHHRNYISKGLGEVTTLRHIIQVVLLGKIAYSGLSHSFLILAGLLAIIIFWVIGYAWDSIKGYDYETEWSNDRNPSIKFLKRKV